jgi:hypothetical protein
MMDDSQLSWTGAIFLWPGGQDGSIGNATKGFGCVVVRGDVLRETVFTATLDIPAYDNAFYYRLGATGLTAKADWSVACRHRSGSADE